ncbi:hypothetical protein MBLNU230_g6324t1 [Neophaeotheca triangularis]
MGAPPGSQVAPLPTNLPFRLVSKTIGSGAYASIRKAIPLDRPKPIIAVKFINKAHALRTGRLKPKQLQIEISLHKSVCPHTNIIRFLSWGDDANWVYMCLELAEGGDLFDKIEADEGVGEDVAHVYFAQLVSAIAWCHGRGVAHRDIKPENMLLSGEGELKLADFGLATQFLVPGAPAGAKRKRCGMVCGSPPYIAPEILEVGKGNLKRARDDEKLGYDPSVADLWSCAIVLFVLLAGNTPWDSPVLEESYEFADFVRSKGKPEDELWQKVPMEVLSLLRGMLRTTAEERFTFEDVRRHPWFTRRNPHLDEKGRITDQIALATRMMEGMHINLNADISASQRRPQSQQQLQQSIPANPNAMDIETNTLEPPWAKLASTQPLTPISDNAFDWEAAPPPGLTTASQPTTTTTTTTTTTATINPHNPPPSTASLLSHLQNDPSMSQFTPTPSVPLTLTQAARQFRDIVPSHSLARFLSTLPCSQLLPMITTALHRLSIPTAAVSKAALEGKEERVVIRLKTVDGRGQLLQGSVVVERLQEMEMDVQGGEVLEVRFLKAKGDPLGWRRLFKNVAVLCREGVVVPEVS